ncbi:hypothetical protein V6N11_000210 [Hibiscus sabdariffa]|uniref:Uncharacterized protein n=2 Tax=Hibiscus sabdariffa TaxID=183260 RepID=A0ABR2NP89_9ROSI
MCIRKFGYQGFARDDRLLKVLCRSNCDDLDYLSNELRLLVWIECPLRILPSSFRPDNLVALLLSHSRIQQLWKGNRPLCKLRVINLKGSRDLIETPNFETSTNLEVLILEGLRKLPEIDRKMERLKTLNLCGCYKVETLP